MLLTRQWSRSHMYRASEQCGTVPEYQRECGIADYRAIPSAGLIRLLARGEVLFVPCHWHHWHTQLGGQFEGFFCQTSQPYGVLSQLVTIGD